MCLVIFTVICALKNNNSNNNKTAPYPNPYGLASYRERLSLIRLARDSASLLILFWGCVFSGVVHVISQLERFPYFLFRSLLSLAPPGVCLWYFRFSGTAVSCWAPFFPSCPKHPNIPVPYQCFESGETKTSPFGSFPQKLNCFSPSLPREKLWVGRFLLTASSCTGSEEGLLRWNAVAFLTHFIVLALGFMLTWDAHRGTCDFLAGFWSCHKVFWDYILLSICLWRGTRSGMSYSIILMMSLYMFYNKIAKCGYQRAPCYQRAALDESVCPHPPSWSFSAQALSWQNSI